ncbi:MAG: ABC transporter ATP-binding protein [Patescibacteria group bacterium]
MPFILEVDHLTKQFGSSSSGFTAVSDISFAVGEGEIVGLLGPNGAGKTTTIMMLLGIIHPTSGSISVFGRDLISDREEILQQMNYSSAYAKLPWRLKVWEALYVFSQLYSVDQPLKRIDTLLDAFQVSQHRETLLGDLSAGNNTRVNLCKAFINNPKLVLLDEPTASLDPDIGDHVRSFIKESRNRFKTTILITSHNMAEIEELCDRVIFLNHGKIVAEDTPEGLAKRITSTKISLMIGKGQSKTIAFCKKHQLPIEVSDRYINIEVNENEIAKLLSDLGTIGVTFSEISIDKPTLEDFFITEVRHQKK